MRLLVEVPFYSRVLDGVRSVNRKPHELLRGTVLLESARSNDS